MAHILEGSVQKSGDAVRVNVQLIKAANDSHHAAARESWREARSELEPFLKEQPQKYNLIGDLALTNMGLGDKAAALALSERARP